MPKVKLQNTTPKCVNTQARDIFRH